MADGAEDGQMIFRTMKDGTLGARLTIDSTGLATFSNGINLGDTNLSNYAEGTWSPVFAGDSTAGTYTHSTTATYTRIGNQVTVYCSLVNITETSAGSGSIKISGLPFASASGGQGYTSASRVRQYSSAVGPFYALVSPTASYVNLMYYVNGSTDAPAPISGLSSGKHRHYIHTNIFCIMALEKTETLKHDIEPNGVVFVETVTTVTDDGAVVGSSNHRKPITPGEDYSAETEVTRNICAAVQTDAVVAAYQAGQAAAEPAAEESSEE